jgi:hypothetical protein
MISSVDQSLLTAIDLMKGEDDEDQRLLQQLFDKAFDFLRSLKNAIKLEKRLDSLKRDIIPHLKARLD